MYVIINDNHNLVSYDNKILLINLQSSVSKTDTLQFASWIKLTLSTYRLYT